MFERWWLKSDHEVECEAEERCISDRPKQYVYKIDVNALTAVGIFGDGCLWFMASSLFEKLWERVPVPERKWRLKSEFSEFTIGQRLSPTTMRMVAPGGHLWEVPDCVFKEMWELVPHSRQSESV